MPALTPADRRQIAACLRRYQQENVQFLLKKSGENLMSALRDDPALSPYVHFIKFRVKGADSLKTKLVKKAAERRKLGKAPDITAENLFSKIGDLVAVRILHLHTDQIQSMVAAIGGVFESYKFKVKEGPTAIVWDQEYGGHYKTLGVKTQTRTSMYMSVHYVVEAATNPKIRVELQVRTLAEEVWGEVDHRVRYKNEKVSRACADQLKVLARMTSGCTRLVDSIIKSSIED